jgi:Flp pilus assembly protein TadG
MSVSGTTAWRRHRTAQRLLGERGAAAVEFALVVPVLLLLLLGIMEYSRAFNAQSTLSAAAREGARTMALANDLGQARSAARHAAAELGVPTSAVTITPSSCTGSSATTAVTVTITHRQEFVSGFLGRTGVDLTGRAAMRCGG